jgi:hypothetical protein
MALTSTAMAQAPSPTSTALSHWNSLPGCESLTRTAPTMLAQAAYCGLSQVGIDAFIENMRVNGETEKSSVFRFAVQGALIDEPIALTSRMVLVPFTVKIDTAGAAYVLANVASLTDLRVRLSNNWTFSSGINLVAIKIDNGATFRGVNETTFSVIDADVDLRYGRTSTRYIAIRAGGSPWRDVSTRVHGHKAQDSYFGGNFRDAADPSFSLGVGYHGESRGLKMDMNLTMVYSSATTTDVNVQTTEYIQYLNNLAEFETRRRQYSSVSHIDLTNEQYAAQTLDVLPVAPTNEYQQFRRNNWYLVPSVDIFRSTNGSLGGVGFKIQGQRLIGNDRYVNLSSGQYVDLSNSLRAPLSASIYLRF